MPGFGEMEGDGWDTGIFLAADTAIGASSHARWFCGARSGIPSLSFPALQLSMLEPKATWWRGCDFGSLQRHASYTVRLSEPSVPVAQNKIPF